MTTVGQLEIETQKRVIAHCTQNLGYHYLGHWQERENNRNVEPEILADWLRKQGHDEKIIDKVLYEVGKAASPGAGKTLYDANNAFYSLLRYGVKVQPEAGAQNVTVFLIDWAQLQQNDFAIAEEVTVDGKHTKRPDIVFYVNGIALGVLELKRSTVSVSEGIRQNLDSQKKEFIQPFYTTVQLVMAGNETEGLRYGVIETREKYWLEWKEQDPDWLPGQPGDIKYLQPWDEGDITKLNAQLGWICGRERFLEILHDFIVFDAGTKKTCRHNQYFGVRASRERVNRREGGILWHTQGSGKSLSMVWLAKWIREHISDGRVLLITDR